ncbi:MAG TPA: aspartate aminotransferase family protein, partial [Spirochaetia bacterium]|nr:aspartate aminotransferase family protein [Spirochaetia bacterium]
MRSHSVHSQTLLKLEERVLKKTVPQLPLLPEYGRGSWLYDESGNRYLDFFTGHGVMCLGHAHPALTEAMIGQIHKLVHTGNHFHLEPRIRLAVRLSELADGGQVFFSNSGAEIVELAIKLCRRRKRGNPRPTIVCMRGSFHGRTYGALSATRQREYKRRLGPFLPGFVEVPFNDPEALNRAMTHHTAGVLIEPVLGEGGVIPATRDYLALARELCTRTGALLVFDEIQTGLGRTGEMFACRRYRVRPDVLLLGKALGGGLPLSALITHPEAASLLGLGDHGST